MTGATTPPLPPSIIFDNENEPAWFRDWREGTTREKAKMQAKIEELERTVRLGQGQRLDGPREVSIEGVRFTETETRILRSFAGFGCALKDTHGSALYRHASNIRKKLRQSGVDPSDPKQSFIRTDINCGYRVEPKFQAYLKRLVAGEPAKKPPALKAPKRILNLEHRSAA